MTTFLKPSSSANAFLTIDSALVPRVATHQNLCISVVYSVLGLRFGLPTLLVVGGICCELRHSSHINGSNSVVLCLHYRRGYVLLVEQQKKSKEADSTYY